MQLIAPDAGDILFDGEAVGSTALPLDELPRQVQMVFQDSYASLNPRLTVEDTSPSGRACTACHDAGRDRARA